MYVPVHDVKGIAGCVGSVFPAEDVEEHLVSLFLSGRHGLLNGHGRLAAVLLAVGLVTLLDPPQCVLNFQYENVSIKSPSSTQTICLDIGKMRYELFRDILDKCNSN